MSNTEQPAIEFVPIEESEAEREYREFVTRLDNLFKEWLFSIPPEETGYEAMSPFRPPEVVPVPAVPFSMPMITKGDSQ